LTPIALSAERIARLLDRGGFPPDSQRILRECAGTISREVESVKTLADEFSQFSRFPRATRCRRSERRGSQRPGCVRRQAGRHRLAG